MSRKFSFEIRDSNRHQRKWRHIQPKTRRTSNGKLTKTCHCPAAVYTGDRLPEQIYHFGRSLTANMAANAATAPYAQSTARISTQTEFRNRLVEANATSSWSLSLSRTIPDSRNCNGILESLGRHQASANTSNGAVMRNRAWAPKSWRKYQNDPSCVSVSRIAVNASSGGHPMSATMKARRTTW